MSRGFMPGELGATVMRQQAHAHAQESRIPVYERDKATGDPEHVLSKVRSGRIPHAPDCLALRPNRGDLKKGPRRACRQLFVHSMQDQLAEECGVRDCQGSM